MNPTEAKVRSLVTWIARRKETESLKPIDKIILGMIVSHWAVTKVNADVASKRLTPEAEPASRGRRQDGWSHLTEAAIHSGGVSATARWQGHAKQLEKPSSSRREIGGAENRITGNTGKSMEDERELEGSIVSMKRGNARGERGPCCLQWLEQHGRQG